MRIILFSILLLIISCNPDTPAIISSSVPIHLNWKLVKNGANAKNLQKQFGVFTLKNTGTSELGDNWAIYFNQNNEPFQDSVQANGLQINHINGNFFRLAPSASYQALAAGQSIEFPYEGNNWSTKMSDAPEGIYIVFQQENGTSSKPQYLDNYSITPFTEPEQINRNASDSFPIPTLAYRYEQNKKVQLLSQQELLPIIPTPKKVVQKAGTLQFNSSYTLCYPKALENERNYLLNTLESIGFSIKDYEGGKCTEKSIQLTLGNGASEGYLLDVNPQKEQIIIEGSDPEGVFYGIQSLRSLLPISQLADPQKEIAIAAIQIEDAPRFPYRGMHLDVSRNFQSKASVEKLLEIMATYKLNKFHFHLSDDEGWRLEIPDLPELTSIGAKRGHTLTEDTHLIPAYGSGPFVDNPESSGSGHFTRSEYIEILKYAKERHIEVIPEIDLPGHARAAIKSMEARYHRLKKAGQEEAASQYLLSDLTDQSDYRSVQGYTDNTTCVCQESLYSFLDKVVNELIAMHQAAGHPLKVLHTGGDEVPGGVWEESPICEELLLNNTEVEATKEGLTAYFLKRFHQILAERNLVTGGWEEIALTTAQQGEHKAHVPNPAFVNKKFQPYVWNSVFGWGGEDMAYQLANAGYPVVLCNASNLYFDLAYDKDPEISGLYWAGYVDTRKTYEFAPFNLFQTASISKMGEILDRDQLAAGKERLSPSSQKNILGMQGHLWSETFINQERLEKSAYPKLLGLAERAWAPIPTWATAATVGETQSLLDKDWNIFANTLGQKEMLRLNYVAGGLSYHIPPPGAIIKEGKLYGNTAYPGLEIYYTTDGTSPTRQSTLYKGPVGVDKDVRLKVFGGKNASREVMVKVR